MKICNRVYQIKIKFNITKHIERYVYAVSYTHLDSMRRWLWITAPLPYEKEKFSDIWGLQALAKRPR